MDYSNFTKKKAFPHIIHKFNYNNVCDNLISLIHFLDNNPGVLSSSSNVYIFDCVLDILMYFDPLLYNFITSSLSSSDNSNDS